jgi:hypothetical protein
MCTGLGSVMSPETVTISTFRQIASHKNGHADHVHVAASAQVAAQIEFWYEEELRKLSERVKTPIDVRVDPAVHPETPLVVWGNGLSELPPVRVGDEFEVELLPTRLPTATSAAAVVNGRLIEVENAANAAGNAIKIRIIDVDGADILAEPRFPIGSAPAAAAVGGEGKKRRRRGGRGRKPLTAAEQQEELRELAEEAAKGLGSRPVPVIGISTTEEAVAEEHVARNEGAPKNITPHVASDVDDLLADALDMPSAHAPRGRAGRGGDRGRGPSSPPPARQPAPPAFRPSAAAAGGLAPLPGETLSGALVGKLPGETLSGDRVNELLAPPPQPRTYSAPAPAAAAPAYAAPESDDEAAPGEADDAPGRKRRRRRRRGRGGNGVPGDAAATAAPATAGVYLDADDDESPEPMMPAAAPSSSVPETVTENDGRKRRRRRRRRRGGSGAATGVLGAPGTLPDRHIIRVDGDGGAQPTGENSPPPPNRALAPWNRPKKGEIAIEPPPPSLSAPRENVRTTAPSRRRAPARSAPAGRVAPIESVKIKALPAPARKKTAATAGAAKKATARTTAAKKTAAPKAAAKKSVAKKSVAKKSTAVRSTAAAKKTPARKTAAAKKTVRKKT